MSELDLLIRGGTVVRPNGAVVADIGIRNGRIAVIAEPGEDLIAARILDAQGLHILPGVIDGHAHIGLGGLEEYDLDTGSAATGGVTTVLYYLISKDSYHPVVEEHLALAGQNAHIDYGYHLTLMTPEHMDEIGSLTEQWGIKSYKFFMHFRGNEGLYMGVTGTDDGLLYGMMEEIARHDGVLAVHAENIEIAWLLRARLKAAGRVDLAAWNESRPPFVEAEAVQRAAIFAAQVGCPLYFVHITSEAGLNAVRFSRQRYGETPIYVETCPHYLTHTQDSEIGPVGKVNPPLRSDNDIAALWQGLADGTFDTVGSDHVGRRFAKKQGNIWEASAGFPGLTTLLPVLLSEGYHKRGLSLSQIAYVSAYRPAEIFKLADRKGDIRVGLDADLALVDLQWERTPDPSWLGTWSDYSIYENWPLKGWPRYTLIRGRIVQEEGKVVAEPGYGRYQEQK
jgi:dihydropyrimidinase